jgi:exodeoxyribonuclease-3
VNAASIRASWGKGLLAYLTESNPDICCVQETKLYGSCDAPLQTYHLPGYHTYFHHCNTRKAYSGTAILTRIRPLNAQIGFDGDTEGRTILLEFDRFFLINVYVPNAGMELERLDFKVSEWAPNLSALVQKCVQTKHVIVAGDFNVAHQDIDIYDPKGHDKTPGFAPAERDWFDGFLGEGFVDVFRALHPELQQFSFFSHRFQMKAKGKGWRLDYFVVDKACWDEGSMEDCLIETGTGFSDHSPVILLAGRDLLITSADLPVEEAAITVLNTGEVIVPGKTEEAGEEAAEEDD